MLGHDNFNRDYYAYQYNIPKEPKLLVCVNTLVNVLFSRVYFFI